MRSNSLRLLILFKGFTAIAAQTLLIRELWVVFEGNELTLALMFGTWLLAGASGSFLASRPWFTKRQPQLIFAHGLTFLAFTLPSTLLWTRGFRPLFGLASGEILSLGQVAFLCVTTLALPAACDAVLFVTGVRSLASTRRTATLDAAGLMAGGLILTFGLIPFVQPFLTVITLAFILALIAAGLYKRLGAFGARNTVWALPAFFFIALIFATPVENWSAGLAWPRQTLIGHRESRQGRLSVLKDEGQVTVALNGLISITAPDPDAAATEDFIHLPLLLAPPKDKILFVGTAAGGLLNETLKYPVREVISLEPDFRLIRQLRSLGDPGLSAELFDPRVRLVYRDPRPYLAKTRERFDAIFIPADLATSLASNRVFTKEFFEGARRTLTPNGILVLRAPGSLAYLDRATKRWNAILARTLRSVFANVAVIPGDTTNIFIASTAALDVNPRIMKQNLGRLRIQGRLLSPAYLDLRLDPAASLWVRTHMRDAIDTIGVNSDLKPLGLYEGLALRYARSSRRLPAVFWGVRDGRLGPVLVGFFIVFALIRRQGWRPHPSLLPLHALALTTGLFGMAAQLLVIFIFQCSFGNIFESLGLLTAAFMAGTALGARATRGREIALARVSRLILIDIAGPVILTALLAVGLAAGQQKTSLFLWGKWGLFGISGGVGYWAGMELVLIVTAILERLPSWMRDRPRVSARVYGLDLVGACIAGIATPLILIPAFGIAPTLLVLLTLKGCANWALSPLKESHRPLTPR